MNDPRRPIAPSTKERLTYVFIAALFIWVLLTIWVTPSSPVTKVALTSFWVGGGLLFTWPKERS